MQRIDTTPGGPSADGALVTRERVLVLMLMLITGLAIYLCYRLVQPFLPGLSWALALAVIAHPLHRWISKRIGRPSVAAGVSLAVVVVALVAPSLFVAHNIVKQATQNASRLEDATVNGGLASTIQESERLGPAYDWIAENIDFQREAERFLSSLAQGASSVLTGSALAVGQMLFALFALYFFFRDDDYVLRNIRGLLPLSNAETDEMFQRVEDTIYGTLYGTVAVAMLQGALGGLMFWFLGLPAPLLWGLIMGLLAIIPYLGTFVIWAPAAGFLLMQGETTKALILIAWGMIAIGLIDNFVYPLLVGKRLRMHPLLALVAIIGGLSLFGSSGLVLGPVAIAILQGLVHVWKCRTAGDRGAEEGVNASSTCRSSPRAAV